MTKNAPVLKVEHLKKTFGKNEVLEDINAEVKDGQVICLVGPSGAGKSTFLRCLNLLDQPTAGKVLFEDKELTALSEKQLDTLREKMGMVFQQFNLFPHMNIIENIKLAPIDRKSVV